MWPLDQVGSGSAGLRTRVPRVILELWWLSLWFVRTLWAGSVLCSIATAGNLERNIFLTRMKRRAGTLTRWGASIPLHSKCRGVEDARLQGALRSLGRLESTVCLYPSCAGRGSDTWKMNRQKTNKQKRRAVVAHAFNPSTWEAEAGGSLSSRPAWSAKWVPRQPGLHRETLSKNQKEKERRSCVLPEERGWNNLIQNNNYICITSLLGWFCFLLNNNFVLMSLLEQVF